MPRRPTPLDLTAAVLVLAAALIWTVWGSRELRRRPTPAPVAVAAAAAATPETAAPKAAPAPASETPQAVPEEARVLLSKLREERSRDARKALYGQWGKMAAAGGLYSEVVAFIREALKSDPEDPAPLGLLAPFPGEKGGDAFLEFAGVPYSKEIRLESLRQLGERGYTEQQLRKASILFDAAGDEDVQVAMLLGTGKSIHPAAEALARKALTDPSETVRAVAMSGLDTDRDLDRRILIGLATSDPSDHVRGSAALQLNDRTADPGILDTLLSVALKDASEENRRLVIGVLKKDALKADARVLDALLWAAERDPSSKVRTEAQGVLDALKKGK